MSAATVTCPSWCTGEHESYTGQAVSPAGGLYGGQVVHESARSQYGAGPAVHIQQYDDRGRTVQDVVLDRWDLSEGDAHELGMALVRAADRIRRARTESPADRLRGAVEDAGFTLTPSGAEAFAALSPEQAADIAEKIAEQARKAQS